jgi:hypothetical protein
VNTAPGACTIKNYVRIIDWKLIDFEVSQFLFYRHSPTLAWTNALTYYGIRTLRILNVYILQAPGLTGNDSFGWKSFAGKNSLAHLCSSSVTKKKGFCNIATWCRGSSWPGAPRRLAGRGRGGRPRRQPTLRWSKAENNFSQLSFCFSKTALK